MLSSLPPSADPESETQGYARFKPRVLLRSDPTVRWTDTAGEHAVTITARSVIGSAARADLVVADHTVGEERVAPTESVA